jgi:hypothetical protein
MNTQRVNHSRRQTSEPSPLRKERPAIFGLRYIEEEAAEIHDVVGCLSRVGGGGTCTSCDDIDAYA